MPASGGWFRIRAVADWAADLQLAPSTHMKLDSVEDPMRKEKLYRLARFAPEVLQQATQQLWDGLSEQEITVSVEGSLTAKVDDATWFHETEAEFFADYRRGDGSARYRRCRGRLQLDVMVFGGSDTEVSVQTSSREAIQRVFEVFESNLAVSTRPATPLPEPRKPKIFIGHGRSEAWRDLKDHLHERHAYEIEAYEIGARAGHAVRDILQDMLSSSAFALLVMTGEDSTADGGLRARQNVVHEAGLFQGRLGFPRAVVLIEDETESFSNIEGIEQIRFARGRIRETFGDVLATLRREFAAAV